MVLASLFWIIHMVLLSEDVRIWGDAYLLASCFCIFVWICRRQHGDPVRSMAKGWYVNYGLERVFKADKLGMVGAERADYLRRAGGVSLPAGIFAGVIYASILALMILAFVVGDK